MDLDNIEWDKPTDAACMICYTYDGESRHYWLMLHPDQWRLAMKDGRFEMLGRKCIVHPDADYWQDVAKT